MTPASRHFKLAADRARQRRRDAKRNAQKRRQGRRASGAQKTRRLQPSKPTRKPGLIDKARDLYEATVRGSVRDQARALVRKGLGIPGFDEAGMGNIDLTDHYDYWRRRLRKRLIDLAARVAR